MASPLQPKQSTAAHAVFPHVWAKSTPVAEPKCSGCAVAALHPSCAGVRLEHDGAESEIQNGYDIGRWQWMMQRLATDADGVAGSYNDAVTDPWYPYNAQGSYNFADSVPLKVVSVSGDEITLESDSDPRHVLLYQRAGTDSTGLYRIHGFTYTGSLKPGFVIQFSGNSVISRTCWPVIIRIVGYDLANNRVTVQCDKVATSALTKFEIDDGMGGTMPDPNDVTCKVWHHEGNPADWWPIIKPDYFFGQQKTAMVPLADIPEDGVYTLVAEKAVMRPGFGFDPLTPMWTMEGQRIDDDSWENVIGGDERLYIQPTWAKVAFKTTAPAEGETAPPSDLTATYDRFRLTYWVKVSPESEDCRLLGYSRCKWSVPDTSGSNNGDADGIAPGWMCLKRSYDVNTTVDNYDKTVTPAVEGTDGIEDTVVHTLKAATGVSRYPADGQCLQFGCCDHWAPAEEHEKGTPYHPESHGGHVFRELWGRADKRLLRTRLFDPSFAAWQAQRVGHPSLAWNTGYVGLQTPDGLHEISRFRGNGNWGLDYYVRTDIDGNEYLELQPGAFEGWRHDDPATEYDGQFPAELGFDFTTTRDPVTPGITVLHRELERVGVAVEKDTGELQPRGISQSSVAVAAQDIVVPNIDLSVTDPQVRGNATFVWDGEGDATITLIPLRQEAKAGGSLGTRTVNSIADQGGGVIRVYLENGEHTFSYVDPGTSEIGDSFDKLITWFGGGIWPIMPKPYQQIDSFYEPNKYTGGKNVGAWPGDSVAPSTDTDRRLIIKAVEPYGGDEVSPPAASNWGANIINKYIVRGGGYWSASAANAEDGYVVVTKIEFTSDSSELIRLNAIEKPVIAFGHYWTDESETYFSTADVGKQVRIYYDVTDKEGVVQGNYDEYLTIEDAWFVNTGSSGTDGIPSADWTGGANEADTITVTADGVTLTAAASAAVASGEYYADTFGTYVWITGHMDQAGAEIKITLTWNTLAAEPDDGWCLGENLTSFGWNYDYIDVYDDPDGVAAALSQGDTLEFWTCDATLMPGATLEGVTYAVDAWTAVADGDIRQNGVAVVPAAWFADKSGKVCFNFKDVRWMDHRGIVPGSLWEKTRMAVAALANGGWVKTVMGSGKGGDYSYGESIEQSWYLGCTYDPGTGTYDCSNPLTSAPVFGPNPLASGPENHLSIQAGGLATETDTQAASMRVNSTSFGAPLPLWLLPDGTEILDVVAEIHSSGITKSVSTYITVYDCSGDQSPVADPPDTSLTGLKYVVVGFTGENEFEVIGEVTASNPNKVEVVNGQEITDIFKIMFRERASNKYSYGYGLMFSPGGFNEGATGVEAFFPSGAPGFASYGPCPPATHPSFYFTTKVNTEIVWDNVSFGTIAIKVKYPDSEQERLLIMPRWPSMAPAVT